MNSRQLANVLVKILGLWTCVQSMPSVATGIFIVLQTLSSAPGGKWPTMVYPLSMFIMLALGIVLIFRSRVVVDKLFAGETE